MHSRRQFLITATRAIVPPLVLAGCARSTDRAAYDEAVRNTWRGDDAGSRDPMALHRELIRYATLAPSSHNTQCWHFESRGNVISVLPDLSRRCPAVDPDDHHLFVSLGCAAENLVQAALAHGLAGTVNIEPARGQAIRIALEPTPAIASSLFAAIPRRQCTRGEFDGRPLTGEEMRLLERAGTGVGVRILLLSEKTAMEKVLEYVVAGNSAQMADKAFVAELTTWIRFSDAEAVQKGDGLFSRATGNTVVPRWLGKLLLPVFYTNSRENEKYVNHVRSSAGLAVFVSEANDPAHWIETGRCYERFALQATALGIHNAFLNQPVEVSAMRPRFAEMLGVAGLRPDLVVRFGRGAEMPRSLRRPVEAVLA